MDKSKDIIQIMCADTAATNHLKHPEQCFRKKSFHLCRDSPVCLRDILQEEKLHSWSSLHFGSNLHKCLIYNDPIKGGQPQMHSPALRAESFTCS